MGCLSIIFGDLLDCILHIHRCWALTQIFKLILLFFFALGIEDLLSLRMRARTWIFNDCGLFWNSNYWVWAVIKVIYIQMSRLCSCSNRPNQSVDPLISNSFQNHNNNNKKQPKWVRHCFKFQILYEYKYVKIQSQLMYTLRKKLH